MPQPTKLLLEPFVNRLPVYGQYQFTVIGRTSLYLENIVSDVKLPSVLFGINPAIASDSLFLRPEVYLWGVRLYHSNPTQSRTIQWKE